MKEELLRKSREAALAAVQIFNSPMNTAAVNFVQETSHAQQPFDRNVQVARTP